MSKENVIKPKNKTATLFKLTLLSLFVAIMIVMDFTPLGYITTGAFSITLMTIPVALGSACCGFTGGAILGALFGLTSFLQAFGIGFMIDPLASSLFTEKPFAYTVTCFVPRILAGLASALIFKMFQKANKLKLPAFAVSAAIVPFLNTLLFMTFFAVFYKNTVFAGQGIFSIIITAFTLNFFIELCVTLVAGTTINKTIYRFAGKFMS